MRSFPRFTCVLSLVAMASIAPYALPSSGQPRVQIIKGSGYHFAEPVAVTGSAGDIWVSSIDSGLTLLKASTGAEEKILIGTKYHFGGEASLAADSNNVWLLAGSPPSQLLALNGATAKVLHIFRIPRLSYTDIGAPLAIVGTSLWLVESDPQHMVAVSTASGRVMTTLAASSRGPIGLWVSRTTAWVLEEAGELQEYDATSGRLVATLRGIKLGTEQSSIPRMVMVDGRLWVATGSSIYVINTRTNRIVRILSSASDDLSDTWQLATNGNLVWSANEANSSVSEFSARTLALETVLKGRSYGFVGPDSITWYEGRVWVSSSQNSLTAFP